jgi:hypothetical protein
VSHRCHRTVPAFWPKLNPRAAKRREVLPGYSVFKSPE